VNLVRGVTEQILKQGHVVRGWLGFLPEDLSPDQSARLGIGAVGGVAVVNILVKSPRSKWRPPGRPDHGTQRRTGEERAGPGEPGRAARTRRERRTRRPPWPRSLQSHIERD